MYSQRLSNWGLAVLASIILVALSVTLTRPQGPDQQCSRTSTKTLIADGGAPVPPYPPSPKRNGSSNSQPTLLADGGAPVPPYPPKPTNTQFLAA